LTGCAVGPNYHAPKTAVPAQWETGTNSAPAIVEWWKTFNDVELNSLIERAVKANHDLRIAAGRLREARALRAGVIWDLGPTIDAEGSWTDKRLSKNTQAKGSTAKVHTVTYDAHFDASWEIDIFGGKRRAVEAALAQYAAIEDD